MPNNIELIKGYAPALAGIYGTGAKSVVLDSGEDLIRAGANANEVMIPVISLDGLADYSRENCYVMGDIDLTWETVKYDYDRGRKFRLDAMDAEESGLSMGDGGEILMTTETQAAYLSVSSQFVRQKVTPEVDAFRFSRYAQAAQTAGNTETATYTDGTVLNARLVALWAQMTDAGVPEDQRYLFINATLNGLSDSVSLINNKAVRDRFAGIIEVPSNRFYSAITLNDGTTAGEEIGGYTKATGASDLNFEIIHKPAVLQHIKHGVNKVIDPVANQTCDGWLFFYRLYQMSQARPGFEAGIYASMQPAA